MGINFTKMQGCGNDFVIIDYDEYQKGIEEKKWKDMPESARKLCDRNFGIGADGFIVPNLNPEKGDIGWFFYNSDGTTAQMCGNGIRCFAKYVYDKKFVDKKEFGVNTLAGIIKPKLLDDETVRVNMSKPILESDKIPFLPQNNLNYKMSVKDKIFTGNAVSMGNPHFVIYEIDGKKIEKEQNLLALAKEYGPIIETSAEFPEKTNVEFIKIKSYKKIELCVWERGCGITLACGTGACASTVAGILNGYIENSVEVELLGGIVRIDWGGINTTENTNNDVFMTGPAEYVFEGLYI